MGKKKVKISDQIKAEVLAEELARQAEINQQIEENRQGIHARLQEKSYNEMAINDKILFDLVTRQVDLGVKPEDIGWDVFRNFRQYWTQSQVIIDVAKHYKRMLEAECEEGAYYHAIDG